MAQTFAAILLGCRNSRKIEFDTIANPTDNFWFSYEEATIRVHVGAEMTHASQRVYCLPLSLLARNSVYSRKALNENLPWGTKNPAYFTHIQPRVFEIWLHWTTFVEDCFVKNEITFPTLVQRLSTRSARIEYMYDTLISCWLLGREFSDAQFQDAAVIAVMRLASGKTPPPWSFFRRAFDCTSSKDGLQKLCWAILCDDVTIPGEWKRSDTLAIASIGEPMLQLFKDYAKKYKEGPWADRRGKSSWRRSICRYHEHAEKRSCPFMYETLVGKEQENGFHDRIPVLRAGSTQLKRDLQRAWGRA